MTNQWIKEEVAHLKILVSLGASWKSIAADLGRSEKSCCAKYNSIKIREKPEPKYRPTDIQRLAAHMPWR